MQDKQKNKNSVCVLMINYFSSHYTIECLGSILNEPLKTIYILDNSADCNEEDYLRENIKELSLKTSVDIIFLSFNENLGFSKGINVLLKYDREKNKNHNFYCLLNNDVIVKKGFIEPLVKTLSEKQVSLVTPMIVWGDTPVSNFFYGRYTAIISGNKSFLSFPYLTGCCIMFENELLDGGDLFDEDFFMYGEDVDLSWRIRNKGLKYQVVKNSLIYHEGSISSTKGSFFYEYHVARAHVLLTKKLINNIFLRVISYLVKGCVLFVRALYRGYRYRSFTPFKAYFFCWFNIVLKDKSR